MAVSIVYQLGRNTMGLGDKIKNATQTVGRKGKETAVNATGDKSLKAGG